MRQVWITAPNTLEVKEVPVPEPAPGEVLVRLSHVGICGSDLHTLHRGHPWLPYPIPPGHEASGFVALSTADAFEAGQPVYLRPAVACGQCFFCARNRQNLCANLIGIGSHRPGAFADYFTVPAAALAPVPDGVSMAAAALIEPLATAVHATTIATRTLADLPFPYTAAILGGGTIGQCVLLSALASGAGAVAVTDPIAAKRDLALSQGAAAAFTPQNLGGMHEALSGRPDVVFDCVASAASLRSAVGLAAPGGTVVVVGVGHGPVELAIESVQDKEVTVAGSAMYLPSDFTAAERLAGASAERLVTSMRPLPEAAEALRDAAAGANVKIQLTGVSEKENRR